MRQKNVSKRNKSNNKIVEISKISASHFRVSYFQKKKLYVCKLDSQISVVVPDGQQVSLHQQQVSDISSLSVVHQGCQSALCHPTCQFCHPTCYVPQGVGHMTAGVCRNCGKCRCEVLSVYSITSFSVVAVIIIYYICQNYFFDDVFLIYTA